MALRFISLILVTFCVSRSAAVTESQEATARTECQAILDINRDYTAGFVRLAFHDCIGGCDGCINLNNNDNAGLRRYADALDDNFKEANAFDWMSRADFWALCGSEAVKRGIANSGSIAPEVDFKFGRQNCVNRMANDDGYDDDTAMNTFPDAATGLGPVLNFFANEFGLTEKETVALLGAHSLGRARIGASGYDGPWVSQPTFLDNQYYTDMIRQGWTQRQVVNPATGTYKWEYSHDRSGRALMLNADICLIKDIVPEADGRVAGSLNDYSDSPTIEYVEEYAEDNQHFLEDFVKVFTKMIERGYDEGALSEATGDEEEELDEEEVEEEESVETTATPVGRPSRPRRPQRPRENDDQEALIRMLARILSTQK